MSLVLAFDQVGATDLAKVGGKAANLAVLARHGLPGATRFLSHDRRLS